MKQLTITGNVGKTPELKQTKDGKDMLVFSVGVYVDKTRTEWVSVMVMGEKRIAYLNDILQSGSKVLVIGDVDPHAYIKNGVAIGSLSLFASSVEVFNKVTKTEVVQEKLTSDNIPF